MPAFDEMLVLEEEIQVLQAELGKAQELAQNCGRRSSEAKRHLVVIGNNIESLSSRIRDMKRVDRVVLLEEYEAARDLLNDNKELLAMKRKEIQKFEADGQGATAAIRLYKVGIAQAESRLEKYNQVLPFKR